MKIELIEVEIEQALIEYVSNQGINLDGSDIEVNLIAGRKNGNAATIEILPKGTLKNRESGDNKDIEEKVLQKAVDSEEVIQEVVEQEQPEELQLFGNA